MNIKNVLLDWSGTLVDVVGYLHQIDMRIFDDFGVPRITREEFQRKLEFGAGKDYMAFFKEYGIYDKERVDNLSKKYGLAIPPDPPIIEDAIITFKELSSRGVDIVILSTGGLVGKTKENIVAKLREIDGKRYIKDVYIAIEGKENVIPILLKEKNFDPKETAIVGDRVSDIKAGKRHDLYTVGVLYGMDPLEKIREANPDYTINSLLELLEILS